MNYKVLYRKYRPNNFSELMGQDNIKDLLVNSIVNNKLSHAYIFTGPRGTGKTSTAKIYAKTVNCENLNGIVPCEKCSFCLSFDESSDIIEIDAASNNGVDEIREIRENVKILPNNSKYKIYIIDEVHMLSSSAWNAFLKTLEEPPNHVIFILATTEIQKVPITVLSRCQRFDFQRITEDVIIEVINKIVKHEKINIDQDAISEIALMSDGGLRDALSILDQLSKLNKEITISTLKEIYGIVTTKEVEELFYLYKMANIKELVKKINEFKSSGIDSKILITKMLDYLLTVYIDNKINNTNVIYNLSALINDLESCYYKSNQYTLIIANIIKSIKIIENNEINQTSEVIEPILNNINQNEIISREIIDDGIININEEILQIRINNSFVNANINIKNNFIKIWSEFITSLFDTNEKKLESLLKLTTVEVVSPTNVLLSTDSYSNSVLLNAMSEQISILLLNNYNLDIKIICLDKNEWLKEKEKFIKIKNKKLYKLIPEPKLVVEEKIINNAENIFGSELIEIS